WKRASAPLTPPAAKLDTCMIVPAETPNVQGALKAITSGHVLNERDAEAFMGAMFDGTAPPLQIAAALGALRVRGETVPELTGFARAMRARAVRVYSSRRPLVDTCGTGGDDPSHGC